MRLLFLIPILFFLNCHPKMQDLQGHPKINFDVSRLDENGLKGPASGKTTLSYEFCIPKDKKEEIRNIDPGIQISNSRGRIGCSKMEYLCIGSTGKDYKKILSQLIEKEYIRRIDETFFE